MWRGPLPIAGIVLAVAAVITFFILTSRSSPGAAEPSPATNSAVVSKVTSIPPSVYDAVRGGSDTTQSFKTVPAGDLLKGASGKPVVLYVGAEYCPYCASQRWALVAALSRFGTFGGLALSSSSSKDVFANTPTFTFRGASFASDVVELQAVELSDRDQRPLRSPDPTQQRSMERFDPGLTVPYLSIADRYYMDGSAFSPDILIGKGWDDIAAALRDPTTPISRAIVGSADRMSAAICAVTQQQPAAVCSSPSVQGLLPTQ